MPSGARRRRRPVEDEHRLRQLIGGQVAADTPYVFFGHSMGSYITRVYLSRHGGGLAAAVICGTGTVAVPVSAAGNLLARAICAVRGEDHRSRLLDSMGAGAFLEGGGPAPRGLSGSPTTRGTWPPTWQTPSAGPCSRPAGTQRSRRSPARPAPRPAPHACRTTWPLLYVSGDGDPVGNMGRGVRRAAKLAEQAGSTDVTCVIYEGMRHEILNEKDHARIFGDVWGWLDQRLGNGGGSA